MFEISKYFRLGRFIISDKSLIGLLAHSMSSKLLICFKEFKCVIRVPEKRMSFNQLKVVKGLKLFSCMLFEISTFSMELILWSSSGLNCLLNIFVVFLKISSQSLSKFRYQLLNSFVRKIIVHSGEIPLNFRTSAKLILVLSAYIVLSL